MLKLGTQYGGWYIPKNNLLNENSIVYSAGVGEDISFDIKLSSIYNPYIFLIDPTKKALNHFNECNEYYKNLNYIFNSNIQPDYYTVIQNEKPNFNKINYLNIGLWDKKDTIKFYKQNNENYVSQSLIENMFSNNYDIVEVNSIKNIMEENNHTHIDLLKMDIEGAEVVVVEQMLNDKIYPTILCIECDLHLKGKDPNNTTNTMINRLFNIGYKLLKNDNYNLTFIYDK